MARDYRPVDRDQVFLLPPSMVDWLGGKHLVWFVIEAVKRLDSAALHAGARLGGVGRRGYDPVMLLTLYVYAMAHGVRSSRRIERLCETDVAFRVICAGDVPDHTVVARFRQQREGVLGDLLTTTLELAAELGWLRFGTVALDGTKIAANASREANRGERGLRRIAEEHLAEAAAADAAEDALFGVEVRGDEMPEKLQDRSRRGQRIAAALAVIEERKAAQAERAEADRAAAEAYMDKVRDPSRDARGRVPRDTDAVAVAEVRYERERARARDRWDSWQAKAAAKAAEGKRMPGTAPRVDDDPRVRHTWDLYQQARAAAAASAAADASADVDDSGEANDVNSETSGDADVEASGGDADGETSDGEASDGGVRANLTDPDSRLLKTRNGWIQGYNCQTGTLDDQFIGHAEATQDANDLGQFIPGLRAMTGLAGHLAGHTGRDLTVGAVLADAGYDSDDNLTTPGPDRLIANRKHRDLRRQAVHNPASGDPPPDATAREAMDHRLRTPDGHRLYTRRAPLAETPYAWLKDRRRLRQFSRRGLAAANSELRFAAAVTNLLRLRTLGVTPTQLATTR